jgi:hypothetical protein
MNRTSRFVVTLNSGSKYLKSVNRQKNNDRIAVNLRHCLASFWIDMRGPEVKARGYLRGAGSDGLRLVGSMANGVE